MLDFFLSRFAVIVIGLSGGVVHTTDQLIAEQTVLSMDSSFIHKSDSVGTDSLKKSFGDINSDSLLMLSKDRDNIIVPYRSEAMTNLHPAHELYKDWHQEFLTPKSFSSKELPTEYDIKVSEFYFPSEGKVTSSFGFRKPRQHYGIDLKIPMKDTIRAAFEGKVRIERYEARGYGHYIVIRHPNGLETIYAHLYKYLVKVNQYVSAGEPIALGDNTGRSSGTHLHFETRFMGNPIDPETFIDFNSKSILAQSYIYTNPQRKIVRNKETPLIVPKT